MSAQDRRRANEQATRMPGGSRPACRDAQPVREHSEEHAVRTAQARMGLLPLEQAHLLPEQSDLQIFGALGAAAQRE
jgi:hypothetical protein